MEVIKSLQAMQVAFAEATSFGGGPLLRELRGKQL